MSTLLLALLAAQIPVVSRTTWPEEAVRGISGVTELEGSHFLAVPERQRFLVPFEVHAGGVSPKPTIPLIGVPDDLDLESIASLPNGKLALGTEGKGDSRSRDRILIASLGKESAKVEGELLFDYQPYGIRAEGNRGVEGLCFADGRLLASAEQVIQEKDVRWAPLQSYDFQEKRWAQYRIRLTTGDGKISALSCRRTPNAREVFAIERHYAVSRVLRFTLPLLDGGGEILPEVLMDLAELREKEIPNFEGIANLPDGRVLLISDNEYGRVQGPTHLLLATPAAKKDRKIKPGAYVQ